MEEIIVDNLRKLEAEFPMYASEAVNLAKLDGAITITVGLIGLIIGGVGIRWFWSLRHREDIGGDAIVGPIIALGLLMFAASLFVFGGSYSLAKAYVAPRVVVIQHLQRQVGN